MWRVAVVYAVTALAVVEAADLFFPRLALPDWSVTLVVVLAVLGFPLALVLAWAFEVSPEGVRRTEPVPGEVALEPGRRRALFAAAAGVALLAGGGWWLLAAGGDGSAPEIERLAVLPLSNLMDDPEQEYFVQGMHDRLISELQQAGVAVIARTSVLHYGKAGTPIREIARELGVDAVIEGSVFRAGDSVEVETRLVDGKTEEYVWRGSFVCELRHIVHLHRDVTRAIAEEIHAALGPQEQARLAEAPTVDPQAYEAYLKGLFHASSTADQGLQNALRYFELALQKDPEYAAAHSGIALVWSARQTMGFTDPREAGPKVEAAAARAIELDSKLADAHLARAWVRQGVDWDWAGAEASYRRAIDLNPNHARARAGYAWILGITGRGDDALAQLERALELDPLNPFLRSFYGINLIGRRRYDAAIAQFREVLRAAPDHPLAISGLWMAFHQKGMYDEALAYAKADLGRYGVPGLDEAAARGHAEGGYEGALERMAGRLEEHSSRGYISPMDLAQAYTYAGDTDRAFEWLERAYEAREPNLMSVNVRPDFDPLRDDPRLDDLLRRMNLRS